jgi:adenylate cyclase
VSLGKDDAVALSRGGFTLAFVANDLDAGSIFIHRALTLNPNLAFAWLAIGWLKVWLGEPEAALQHLAHTIRPEPARLDDARYPKRNSVRALVGW